MYKKRLFINTLDDEDPKSAIWSEQEVRTYYNDLRKNGEYTAIHSTFEEWLIDQEQFKEME